MERFRHFDKLNRRAWQSTPANSGYENNYHKIDVPGVSPMAVEDFLANKVENEQARVLREIIKTEAMPTTQADFDVLMNFIALSFGRGPSIRDAMAVQTDKAERLRFLEMVKDPNNVTALRAMCATDEESEIFEEVLQSGISDDVIVTWDRTSVVVSMLYAHETVLQAVAERKWNLFFVGDNAPDLVTSDLPVAPIPKSNPKVALPEYGLKVWQEPSVFTVMPLTRRIGIMGDRVVMPPVTVLSTEGVGVMNYHVTQFAKYAFSSSAEYPIWQGNQLYKADAKAWMPIADLKATGT